MEEKNVRLSSILRLLLAVGIVILTLIIFQSVEEEKWLIIADYICIILLLIDYSSLLKKIVTLKETIGKKENALEYNIQYIKDTDAKNSKEIEELKAGVESLHFWKQQALLIDPDLEKTISPGKLAEDINSQILEALQLDDSPQNFIKIRKILMDYYKLPPIVKSEVIDDIHTLRSKYDSMVSL